MNHFESIQILILYLKCNLQSEIVSSLISQVMMWTHLTIFLNHSSLFFIRTFPWIILYCPSLQYFHGLFLNASQLTLSLDLGGTGMQHIQVINHAGSSGTNTINMSAPVFQEFGQPVSGKKPGQKIYQCKHCDQTGTGFQTNDSSSSCTQWGIS